MILLRWTSPDSRGGAQVTGSAGQPREGGVSVLVGGAVFKGAEALVLRVGLTRRNAC